MNVRRRGGGVDARGKRDSAGCRPAGGSTGDQLLVDPEDPEPEEPEPEEPEPEEPEPEEPDEGLGVLAGVDGEDEAEEGESDDDVVAGLPSDAPELEEPSPGGVTAGLVVLEPPRLSVL